MLQILWRMNFLRNWVMYRIKMAEKVILAWYQNSSSRMLLSSLIRWKKVVIIKLRAQGRTGRKWREIIRGLEARAGKAVDEETMLINRKVTWMMIIIFLWFHKIIRNNQIMIRARCLLFNRDDHLIINHSMVLSSKLYYKSILKALLISHWLSRKCLR